MRFSSVAVSFVALLTSSVQAFAPTHAFSSSVVRSSYAAKEPSSALFNENEKAAVESSETAKEMIDEFRNNMGNRGNHGAKKVC
jgi:hypothetical protein